MKEQIDKKPLPCFRDIPIDTKFRLPDWRGTLWVKTRTIRVPGGCIYRNAVEIDGDRHATIGWNAKVMLEYLPDAAKNA